MKEVFVGTYYLGCITQVNLYLRPDTGGNFHCTPDKGELAYIKIGADDGGWHRMVEVLVHESMELSYVLQGCRYGADNSIANDSGAWLFVADHVKFGECCAMTGDFLAVALPAMAKAWKTWKTEAKKQGKK